MSTELLVFLGFGLAISLFLARNEPAWKQGLALATGLLAPLTYIVVLGVREALPLPVLVVGAACSVAATTLATFGVVGWRRSRSR